MNLFVRIPNEMKTGIPASLGRERSGNTVTLRCLFYFLTVSLVLCVQFSCCNIDAFGSSRMYMKLQIDVGLQLLKALRRIERNSKKEGGEWKVLDKYTSNLKEPDTVFLQRHNACNRYNIQTTAYRLVHIIMSQ